MSKNTNILAGIIGGTAAGLAIGMLYAPDKGAVTRKKIKEKAVDVKDDIVDRTNSVTDSIARTIGSRKSAIDQHLDQVINEMSDTTDDAIVALERKLEKLKKESERIQMN